MDNEGAHYCDQDSAQESPQPCEDSPEVISDGGECIGGVAGTTFEIAAAEVTFGLEVADHGLDGGSAPQLMAPNTPRFWPEMLASPFKSKIRLEAENAVLRHQLIVLRRKVRG